MVGTTWPQAIVRRRIIRFSPNTFTLGSHMSFKRRFLLLAMLFCALRGCDGGNRDSSAPKNDMSKSGKQIVHKHYIHQQHFDDDDWVDSLIWNLIGYSTVLVPAFIIFRMAKYSNFNEREGNLCC